MTVPLKLTCGAKWAYVWVCECVCACWHDIVWTLFDQFKPARAAEADFGMSTAEKQKKVISGLQWIGSNVWIKWARACVWVHELCVPAWQALCTRLCATKQNHVAPCFGGWYVFALVWACSCICMCVFQGAGRGLRGDSPVCVLSLASLGCAVCAQKANQVIGQGDIPARLQCLQQLWQHVNGQTGNVLKCFSADCRSKEWKAALLCLQEIKLKWSTSKGTMVLFLKNSPVREPWKRIYSFLRV